MDPEYQYIISELKSGEHFATIFIDEYRMLFYADEEASS